MTAYFGRMKITDKTQKTESIILYFIEYNCWSNPLSIPSVTISVYINGMSGASILIYFAASLFLQNNSAVTEEKIIIIIIQIIEYPAVYFKHLLTVLLIPVWSFNSYFLASSGIITADKDDNIADG